MAHDANSIFIGATGIEIADIQAMFGLSDNDIGALIRRANINKWSFHKPIRFNSWAPPTDAQIVANQCGLYAVTVSKILSMAIGADAPGSYSKSDCISEILEWGYNKPRGQATYNEPYRFNDFDPDRTIRNTGYLNDTVAPDSNWAQRDFDSTDLAGLASAFIKVVNNGDYTGYNFKMIPKANESDSDLNPYNVGIYEGFAMLFGDGSADYIGDKSHMDIPIKYVVPLTGDWRIALAVCIPDFHGSGLDGWGFFTSRMTINQVSAESASLVNLLPDFATNPFVASVIQQRVSSASGGYITFDAVPLLVKDLGYTYINSLFAIRPVADVSSAYCMPSGTRAFPVVFGTPPMTLWYEIIYIPSTGHSNAAIKNKDTADSHTFSYQVLQNGVISSTGSVNLQPQAQQIVGGAPSGVNLTIVITAQDGTPI